MISKKMNLSEFAEEFTKALYNPDESDMEIALHVGKMIQEAYIAGYNRGIKVVSEN